MKNRFERKVVWITGGGSGLGKAMALAFAREGAMVAVSGRRRNKLEETVREIDAEGGRGLVVVCDVSNEQQIIVAADQIVNTFGRLDIAVANAAAPIAGGIEEMELHDWHRVFGINVFGLAMTAKYALPELRKTKGRLVLIGSGASLIAFPGYVIYTASKYAMRAIGQTLAMELHGSGVSCTNIYPGFVDTELIQVDNQGKFNPDRKKRKRINMWPAEKAANVCLNAIQQRKLEYTFTTLGKTMGWFGRHMPGLYHFLLTRIGSDKIMSYEN